MSFWLWLINTIYIVQCIVGLTFRLRRNEGKQTDAHGDTDWTDHIQYVPQKWHNKGTEKKHVKKNIRVKEITNIYWTCIFC